MSQPGLDPSSAASTQTYVVRNESVKEASQQRRRRKNSSLGGEPRGDTGAAALATLAERPSALTSQRNITAADKARPHSKRRKAKTLLRRWKANALRHTWLNPLLLILLALALYAANPSPSNPLHACLFLSYPLPRPADAPPDAPIQYGKGRADFAFVAFYTVVLSFTREFLMQRLIRPLAGALGIRSRAKQSRFMEQFYTAIYFGLFGPFGLYVMSRTPTWYFNTAAMYADFPHRTHEALFKSYYLLQASYWAQQGLVLILMLEKPRKDFKELVLHHVITLSLIWLSYRFHFTYMGLAVYITHDISDFFLAVRMSLIVPPTLPIERSATRNKGAKQADPPPSSFPQTSKTLNYLSSPLTVPYFAMFIGIWTYLRHYLNLRILHSILTEFAVVGRFDLSWPEEQYKCWISQYISFALLACLQAVNLFWLFLIVRIAWRMVMSQIVADERSEDEEEEGFERELEVAGRGKEEEGDGDGVAVGPKVLVNGVPVGGFDEVGVQLEEVGQEPVKKRVGTKSTGERCS
ncbi:sphingosine N-acyltransferase lag1 [Elasticomyces elasticus]|nr:sphingosine N-acyltransferase lag1 [Elasticomyces elasticus]